MAKTKFTNEELVLNYMKALKHPMIDVIEALRKVIVSADKKNIEETIAWNAPIYNYSGEMKPFNPKEYKRYIVGFNLFQKDCIRLIFLTGSKLTDSSKILEGDYKDGRRLVLFRSMADVKKNKKALQTLIKEWITMVD